MNGLNTTNLSFQDLEQSQKKANNAATKERIKQQILEAKKALEDIQKRTQSTQ